jgi:hypothetical protein
MLVSKKDLENTQSLYKKWGWKKEDFFPILFLSREFHQAVEELKPNVLPGKSDLGINAFYLDRDRRNFYLYCFLWTENHKQFKEHFQTLIQTGIETIFSETNKKNPFLSQLRSQIYENQSIIDRVFIYFVFNGDPEKAQNSDTMASLREDLESKKFLMDSYFSNKEVTLTVDFLSNENKRRGGVNATRKTHKYKLQLNSMLERQNSKGHKLYLGFLKALDLYKMYEEMGLRLFEKNIRAGLSPENNPNKSIRKSLKNILAGVEDYKNFSFHHNGVTIAAEHVEFSKDFVEVTEPRILNGAQTVTSIAKFLEENTNTKNPPENNAYLQGVEILGKIILPKPTEDPSDFIVNVTINNNRQNPVEPWNLRASDMIQLEFSDKFREELGIYYERQENAFDSLSLEDMEDMKIVQNKSIQIKRLAQTFMVIQGEVDKVSRMRDLFEDEKKYYNTFRKRYLNVDSRKILLLYKVQFRLKSAQNTIMENSSEKYFEFYSKSKNLIWGLIIQGILNDSKLDFFIENYGKNLLIEANFNELVKGIGDKKVRPILSEIWKAEKYQKNIQEQNYSFLKTRAIFDHAMAIAREKFNWSKMDI